MAKTKTELDKLKNDYESLTAKLNELTEDELKQVTGGGLEIIGPYALGSWHTHNGADIDNQFPSPHIGQLGMGWIDDADPKE